MLKLKIGKREAEWLDASQLGEGLRFQMLPVTPAMVMAARSSGAGAVLDGLKDAGDPLILEGRGEAAFTRLIVQAGLVGWEGVGDEAGQPIKPSPEAIDALLYEWPVFKFFDLHYVGPALAPSAEKNGSSPSRNGTSGAKTQARTTAKRVRRAAKRAPTK